MHSLMCKDQHQWFKWDHIKQNKLYTMVRRRHSVIYGNFEGISVEVRENGFPVPT